MANELPIGTIVSCGRMMNRGCAVDSGGSGPPGNNGILQEDGIFFIMMEDGTSFILQE